MNEIKRYYARAIPECVRRRRRRLGFFLYFSILFEKIYWPHQSGKPSNYFGTHIEVVLRWLYNFIICGTTDCGGFFVCDEKAVHFNLKFNKRKKAPIRPEWWIQTSIGNVLFYMDGKMEFHFIYVEQRIVSPMWLLHFSKGRFFPFLLFLSPTLK